MKYKKFLLILSLFFTTGLQGCFPFMFFGSKKYTGDHSELFTVAIHSLINVRGYVINAPPVSIRIIEKDEYGRVLFYYVEGLSRDYRLIAQKSDSTYVYYYPNFNFISGSYKTPISEQAILEFKEKNDWNKPLDESKFIKQRIVRKKAKYRFNKDTGEKIFREAIGYNGSATIFQSSRYITSDKYGKKMFRCLGEVPKDSNYNNKWTGLLVIIDIDGSCDLATCFTRLTVPYHHQHELKAFKELNNWSEPWVVDVGTENVIRPQNGQID